MFKTIFGKKYQRYLIYRCSNEVLMLILCKCILQRVMHICIKLVWEK